MLYKVIIRLIKLGHFRLDHVALDYVGLDNVGHALVGLGILRHGFFVGSQKYIDIRSLER